MLSWFLLQRRRSTGHSRISWRVSPSSTGNSRLPLLSTLHPCPAADSHDCWAQSPTSFARSRAEAGRLNPGNWSDRNQDSWDDQSRPSPGMGGLWRSRNPTWHSIRLTQKMIANQTARKLPDSKPWWLTQVTKRHSQTGRLQVRHHKIKNGYYSGMCYIQFYSNNNITQKYKTPGPMDLIKMFKKGHI